MRLALIALLLSLAGCSGFLNGGLSGAPSAASGITSQLDQTINAVILQKLQDAHNLGIAVQQITSAPGMVSVVMPAPVVAQPSPAPVTMTPAPTPTPMPVPTMPTAPVPTGTNPPANLP